MKTELELKLTQAFPRLYKPNAPLRNPTHFRFEHGNGWFDLIWNMSEIINTNIDDIKKNECTLSMLQIKEKFGNLRIYYAFRNRNKETIGLTDSLIEIKKNIEEATRFAENQSAKTCEECGISGIIRSSSISGWLKCLCNKCFAADLVKQEIRNFT
jgi:hypothetical protein